MWWELWKNEWWTSRSSWKSNKHLKTEKTKIDKLTDEIWEAHAVWLMAHNRLNQAQEVDEIDYAIYMLEAAEKRYDMLVRRAKVVNLEMSQWR